MCVCGGWFWKTISNSSLLTKREHAHYSLWLPLKLASRNGHCCLRIRIGKPRDAWTNEYVSNANDVLISVSLSVALVRSQSYGPRFPFSFAAAGLMFVKDLCVVNVDRMWQVLQRCKWNEIRTLNRMRIALSHEFWYLLVHHRCEHNANDHCIDVRPPWQYFAEFRWKLKMANVTRSEDKSIETLGKTGSSFSGYE